MLGFGHSPFATFRSRVLGGLPAALTLVGLLATPLAARQEAAADPSGAVRGRLVRGQPLSGAVVTVRGTAVADTTDASGAFLLAGVPPGPRVVEARHPQLARLGLAPLEQTVRVTAGDTVFLPLAVPSARAFRSRLCPDSGEKGRGDGVFVGKLVRRETGRPLPGVRVRVAWRDPASPSGAGSGGRLVRADSVGRFVACGIPPGSVLQALIGTGEAGRRTDIFRMPENGYLVRRIAYGEAEEPAAAAPDTAEPWPLPNLPADVPVIVPPLRVPIEGGCSTVDQPEFYLKHYEPLFVDEEAKAVRARLGIDELEGDLRVEVVADPRICDRLLAQARRVLREELGLHPARQPGFDHVILRYGPLVAVFIGFESPKGVQPHDNSVLLVFDGETLEFLGWTF